MSTDTQPQVAPTPVGRQLPIPYEMLHEIADELTRLCSGWANRLSGVDLDDDAATMEHAQQWLLAQMTATEAAARFIEERQRTLAKLAKLPLGISDRRVGQACGISEQAAAGRARRSCGQQ